MLEEVAPIVSNIGEFPNALSAYLRTLREAAERFSDYLFVPGHGTPFRNPEAAVRKAERYYRKHCDQLEKIVRDEGRPVLLRDVGSMAYRRYRRPLTMKEREVCIQIWFKTYACLKYLEEQGAASGRAERRRILLECGRLSKVRRQRKQKTGKEKRVRSRTRFSLPALVYSVTRRKRTLALK